MAFGYPSAAEIYSSYLGHMVRIFNRIWHATEIGDTRSVVRLSVELS